jgi:hypothetical protein
MSTHLVIPDVQVKDGVPTKHLKALGKFIVDKQPDKIICLGDFADMPSLSSYDKGHRSFEGRRYRKDTQAAVAAMETLLQPLHELQEHQRRNKVKIYKPEMTMILGNHENRIDRATELSPEYDGVISMRDLEYEEFGWKVIPFLQTYFIDGVGYVHYVKNRNSNNPKASVRAAVLDLMHSVTCGHKPTLDVFCHFTGDGRQVWGVQAGAYYMHDEEYRAGLGNEHWRGVIWKDNVRNGEYDPTFITLGNLIKEYGE